jgi:signal transduction histidine kinase
VQNSINSNNIRTVNEDEHGNLWFGTDGGLGRFNRDDQTFERFSANKSGQIVEFDDDIIAIQSGSEGQLWFGSMGWDLSTFSLKNNTFNAINSKNVYSKVFNKNRVNSIFKDAQNTLWFATANGVVLISQNARNFNYLSNKTNSLRVTDIRQLNNNQLAFVGNWGFYEFDPKTKRTRHRFNPIEQLARFTQDSKNQLWFATVNQGIQKFTPPIHRTIPFSQDESVTAKLGTYSIHFITPDANDNIWAAFSQNKKSRRISLLSLNTQTQQHQFYDNIPNISNMLFINQHELLIAGVAKSLFSLNTQNGELTNWSDKIPSTPINADALYVDSKSTLWVGTPGRGLASFNRQSQTFNYYNSNNGLLSDNVLTIVEDDHRNLWLGTNIGLSRFNINTREFTNFDQSDGLKYARIRKNTAIKMKNGFIAMGSADGVVMFDPLGFTVDSAPSVIINDFKLLNQSVLLRREDPASPLTKSIEFTNQLVLSHRDQMFSFSFAALEYIRPAQVKFAYKMQGLNDQWFYTDADNRIASYTTLPSGDYTFRVKASNKHGVWSNKETTIQVTILPPWYLTWPAYLLYGVLTALGIYLFIHLRTKKLVEQAKELEQNVVGRTQQLQDSRDQLEQSHGELAQQSKTVSDLLAQKQRLFASVSHEFRTPLTLILSPVDQLLNDDKGRHITKELGLIRRSGRRLLRMVDQLLEFAKLEQRSDVALQRVSLQQTLNIIVASFEPVVQSKKIGLKLFAFNDITLLMQPDSLNKILINILSNACKYTPRVAK